MLKTIKHLLFGHQETFSEPAFEEEKKQIALESGGRPSRGNVSGQFGHIVTDKDMQAEARLPSV